MRWFAVVAVGAVSACLPGRPTEGGPGPVGEGEGEGEGRPISFVVTDALSGFLNTEQPRMHDAFLTREDTINAETSASGQFRSGAHITRSLDNMRRSVNGFTEGAIAVVVNTADGQQIDREPLRALLVAHRPADERFFEAYYADITWVDDGPRLQMQRDAQDIISDSYTAAVNNLP